MMPVAVWPTRLAAHLGAAAPIVAAPDWSIGHAHDKHPTTPADWLLVQAALDRGEVQAEAAGDALWLFVRSRSGEEWFVRIERRGRRWIVTNLFRPTAGPRYRLNQAARPGRIVLLNEDDENESAGGRP
jgi:hypothetical protein